MSAMGSIHVSRRFNSGEFCVGISLAYSISFGAASMRFMSSLSGKMPVLYISSRPSSSLARKTI